MINARFNLNFEPIFMPCLPLIFGPTHTHTLRNVRERSSRSMAGVLWMFAVVTRILRGLTRTQVYAFGIGVEVGFEFGNNVCSRPQEPFGEEISMSDYQLKETQNCLMTEKLHLNLYLTFLLESRMIPKLAKKNKLRDLNLIDIIISLPSND